MDNPVQRRGAVRNHPAGKTVRRRSREAWKHLLAHMCREMILADKPLRLDRETIRRYGFTREDVKRLEEPVERCNRRIIAELREQYDRLEAITCLHG